MFCFSHTKFRCNFTVLRPVLKHRALTQILSFGLHSPFAKHIENLLLEHREEEPFLLYRDDDAPHCILTLIILSAPFNLHLRDFKMVPFKQGS